MTNTEALSQDTFDEDSWDDGETCERCGRVDVELDEGSGLCSYCEAGNDDRVIL